MEIKTPVRRSLPNRRAGYNHKLRVSDQTVYIRTGEYEDGGLGEVFLDVSRTGSALRAMLSGVAMAVSVGLQYGVPLQEYVDLFKGLAFEPSGNVEGDERMKEASSILDCVFRELELTYINRVPPALENCHDLSAARAEARERAATAPVEKIAGRGVSSGRCPHEGPKKEE